MVSCNSQDLFRKMAFHFNVSLTAINLAKGTCKRMKIKYSVSSCKSVTHNANMLEETEYLIFILLQADTTLIDKIFKELLLFTAEPLRLG